MSHEMVPVRATDLPGSHFVQFYEEDSFLIDEVADFLDEALRSGDTAIVLATPAHRAALHRRLGGLGSPGKDRPWYPGELIALDARETLNTFMVGGVPDEARFMATVGALVERVSRGARRPLRLFGEMVVLLCEDGQPEAALQLEALWNRLREHHTFELFCAYPMRLFPQPGDSQTFRHLCSIHTRIRPAESQRLDSVSADPMTLAALQQKSIALQNELDKRIAAERTLRRREKELSDFLENSAEGLHRVGGDGTILWANRAELTMLGYAAEEYIGRSIAEFYVDPHQIADILRRLKAGETLYDQPAALRCKDGSIKHVLVYSNAYFEEGQLLYTRCFTRDVTERMAREQAEHERNSLLMQAPVGTALLMGPDHVYQLANQPYCDMFGLSLVVGTSAASAFPALGDQAFADILATVYTTGQPFVANECAVWVDRRGEGAPQECFFRFNLQPLRTPGGKVYGVLAMAIDISELVQGRRAIEQTHAERARLMQGLEDASRAKDEFLAMLGHELRNPLSPIVTALQLMKMRGDVQSNQEQAVIQRQVDHLIRLVDDLLDIARITRGKVELRKDSTEIAQVIAKAIEIVRVLFEQRRHHLTIDVPATGLMWHGDATRLAQVVANLLANAARYTEPGGQISVSARCEGPQAVICVKDNGRGLNPDVLTRVFDMFFQGHRSIERAEGGLGIGLALVKNLVELHGGTVAAHSEGLGRGSEFVVRLPLSLPGALSCVTEPTAQAAAHIAAHPRRVLIVDDNADAADSLAVVLTQCGHEVKVAYDPVTALRLVEHFVPEVALLDIGLPVMDGYALAARLRDTLPASVCRLFALTGYGQDADRHRSHVAGFDGHLVKPIAMDRMLDLISQR